jgi:hypothetical protein
MKKWEVQLIILLQVKKNNSASPKQPPIVTKIYHILSKQIGVFIVRWRVGIRTRYKREIRFNSYPNCKGSGKPTPCHLDRHFVIGGLLSKN